MAQGNPKQELSYGAYTGRTHPLTILELKVVLGFAQGHGWHDIAKDHNTSISSVKDAAYRARKRLKVELLDQIAGAAEERGYIWRTADAAEPPALPLGSKLLRVSWKPLPKSIFEHGGEAA